MTAPLLWAHAGCIKSWGWYQVPHLAMFGAATTDRFDPETTDLAFLHFWPHLERHWHLLRKWKAKPNGQSNTNTPRVFTSASPSTADPQGFRQCVNDVSNRMATGLADSRNLAAQCGIL